MAQSLSDAPVESSADEQKTARRRMLQQCVVNGLFRSGRVGHVEQDDAVFVNAPASFRPNDGQASVDRVARRDQVHAAPEVRLGDGFQISRPTGKRQYGGNANQAAHRRAT